MSITDELREWMRVVLTDDDPAHAIADRIDERVSNIRFNEYHKGYQDGIMDGCSHYDPERTECMVSEEYAYIRLPVDADGVPIHIGDEVEEFDTRTVGKARGEVIRIVFNKRTTDIRIDTGTGYADRNPMNVRHVHHEPTVEDVLREFAQVMNENMGNYVGEVIDADEWRDTDTEAITEYAEKLREVTEHERD